MAASTFQKTEVAAVEKRLEVAQLRAEAQVRGLLLSLGEGWWGAQAGVQAGKETRGGPGGASLCQAAQREAGRWLERRMTPIF